VFNASGPREMVDAIRFLIWAVFPEGTPGELNAAVSVGPGLIALTRMARDLRSLDHDQCAFY
jgi:hypothetical protein